jgi:hypothetical protein
MTALLLLPRRWALLPLLVGACYITRGQIVQLGPLTFFVSRIIIAAGLVRVIIHGERLPGRMHGLDWLMVVWSVWMLTSSLFHENPSTALVNRLGLIYDACGIYFLVRVLCQSFDEVVDLCRLTAIMLLPIALGMIFENPDYNLFYALTGDPTTTEVRAGRFRAQGPFAHAIIAGTIGAVCLPLMVPLWRLHRKVAVMGIGTCLAMVFTSASSGPIFSMMAAVGALFMWRFRDQLHFLRWLAVGGYIALSLVMNDPVYYIIARSDIVGGSTGWHRAKLIQSAIEHLPEWWLKGTDYTRHWMPTGVPWTEAHTDITNHYLQMGVNGGLPLMLLFIAILAKAFSFIGRTVRQMPELSQQSGLMAWALGASLFAHSVTFVSVSYFDQSVVFLYLTLALIGSVSSGTVREGGSGNSDSVISGSLA